MSVQGSAIRTVHSTHRVQCSCKGGETDWHYTEIPSSLSPAYSGPSRDLSEIGLAGELGEIRAGPQASIQLCGLPLQPPVWLGPTHKGTVAEPSTENTRHSTPTSLSGPAVHVLD